MQQYKKRMATKGKITKAQFQLKRNYDDKHGRKKVKSALHANDHAHACFVQPISYRR